MADPATTAGAAASSAGSKVSRFLTVRQFGMPRWVFVVLLAGGVGLGIYLRRRSPSDEELTELDGDAEVLATDPLSVDDYAMLDPGLAGAGYVPGPAAGSVVPVSSPFIPEGLDAVLGNIADIFDVIGRNPDAFNPDPDDDDPPPTGGGPPGRRGNRVIGVLTAQERRRLDRELRPEARRAARGGVTRRELRGLLADADSRTEKQRIRRAVLGGQGFPGYPPNGGR